MRGWRQRDELPDVGVTQMGGAAAQRRCSGAVVGGWSGVPNADFNGGLALKLSVGLLFGSSHMVLIEF